MGKTKIKNSNLYQAFRTLGFDIHDDSLYLTNIKKELPDPQIEFHLEKARDFKSAAVYLRKQLNGSYKPQAYLFDFTSQDFSKENQVELTEIQKKIWSSGEAPLACIFYRTEIKILDCTTHINDNYTPVHLIHHLEIAGKVHALYNEQFAVKLKSGLFWEQEELKSKFKFQNSSYDKLIENIRIIINKLKETYKGASTDLLNKIIVQSILVKYLEERIDDDGNKLLSDKYFKKYDKASTFIDVLKKGKFVDLLEDLNDPKKGFNGNIFQWNNDEQKKLQKLNLSVLANLLDTSKTSIDSEQLELDFPNWRYFEFKYIPVELISRLYEEFLGEDKKDKGLFYTPSHLTKLLIDESLPLKTYKNIDLENFHIIDPACGSGIFLVIAFKRLVQIWRLQNKMNLPELSDLKKILRNIYGVDKEEQAVHLASFSLCLALCNELNPIEIINKLKFDDLRETNLINSDFFSCSQIKGKKFDLIIGNPPFNRGAIKSYSQFWEFEDQKINIPQGQIALKFLSESLSYLKDKGLLCLIIKSSGLLYNSSSESYKRALFSHYNVIQLLDFTALARNKSLWDNGADVASAAIFLRNEKPNFKNNILHLTFRRTKATKERIVFEVDDYDLHFVGRQKAIDNEFIWKNNLLGGGRIQNLVEKFHSIKSFDNY
ncbi:MAG: N-6 DNA methylase, partial [Bacteroidia bacterium]|nr:N-6 DNA methylase [Bacteroidia bacterium]